MATKVSNTDLIFPVYPLFIAIYPVLALYGNNIDEVAANVIWRPLLLSLLGGLIVWLLVHVLLRDLHRSALFTSILLLVFFVYGHAFLYLRFIVPFESKAGWHFILFPSAILALALALWWIWKKMPLSPFPARLLNPMAAFLLVYPLIQATTYLSDIARSEQLKQRETQVQSTSLHHGYAPDIYYFILDGYGRNDVLQESLGYDNASFTDGLKEMGFYVAECSQSNYSITLLSLGSSLNMDYMDNVGADGKKTSESIKPETLVVSNAVRKFLKGLGYEIIAFENGYIPSRWHNADYFFVAPDDNRTNNFEWLFIGTSAARAYFDVFSRPPENRSEQATRSRTLFALEQFDESIPAILGPKFVFAHLIIPHPPYVFTSNGEMPSPSTNDKASYIGQVQYINIRINEIVQRILKDADTPPIIIIQGDHGPDGKLLKAPADRMKILNAYYLPLGSDALYSTISPINSFRIVFNEFFGTSYKLLEDKSLQSTYDQVFEFRQVPNQCQQ